MALGWLWWRAWFPVDAVVAAAVCVTGVALGGMDVHSAWQAWHLATSTFTLRGICMALVALGWLWWRDWFPVDAVVAAAVCVAGVALGDIDLHFCVACVALGDIDVHSAWQAWRFAASTCILRGRRGTYGTGLALVARLVPSLAAVCVAGVVLGDIDLHFAWQAWRLATSTCILRGRRGTWRHRRAFCVAGVALGDIDAHSVWQVRHLRHWAGSGGALGSHAVVAVAVCVAGVALGDIDVHLAWQAWRFATSTCVLRGRCGT